MTNTAADFHRAGNDFLDKENFAAAAEEYKKALALAPKIVATHFRLGLAYFSSKNFELAKQEFQTVLSLEHTHPNANQCLANSLLELGDHETAIHYYFRQMEKNPWFETYYNLGVLFMMKDKLQDAISYFNKAIEINPNDVATQINLGNVYLKKNIPTEALTYYEKANSLKPNDAEILHILSALQQKEIPNTAPAEYITHLFDQYAPYYDLHLTKALKYDSPEKILRALQLEYPEFSELKSIILDLGCGTGLCGALFKPYAQKLIGVDLSENMLVAAKYKQIYDELIKDDITRALTRFSNIDLILAADVFTYCGDLELTFKNAFTALKNKGLFIFTVEKTAEKPFILQTSIRYAHSKSYLTSLATKHHFEIVQFDNIVLRNQQNKPVEGYLVFLKKN